MKQAFLITLCITSCLTYLQAQDGSNIRYLSPNELNNDFIGSSCHIDVGRASFGGLLIDTFEIDINDQPMRFYEHRVDNGYNNWFDEQYLIRIDDYQPLITRLETSVIDSLTTDRLYVTSVLGYYMSESAPIDTITIIHHSYEWQAIAKVLIKAEKNH